MAVLVMAAPYLKPLRLPSLKAPCQQELLFDKFPPVRTTPAPSPQITRPTAGGREVMAVSVTATRPIKPLRLPSLKAPCHQELLFDKFPPVRTTPAPSHPTTTRIAGERVSLVARNGSTGDQTTPVAVSQGAMPSGATTRMIVAAGSHTCAIASDNMAYCWGYGTNGRLGNGSTGDQTTPVAVSQGAMPSGATIQQLSASDSHTCAIGSDSMAYCWGQGANGRLGNGSTGDQTTPVAVSQGAMPSGATIQQISAGPYHACAIASNNATFCWGAAATGRLGYGGTSQQTTPVAVSQGAMPSGATIRQVGAGRDHACAIASNNTAFCWGADDTGQLGNGTPTGDQTTPVAVSRGAIADIYTIDSSQLDLSLEFAPLGIAGECSAVASGWQKVTSTTEMSWGGSPPSHPTAIGAFGSDPSAPTGAGYSYQSIVRYGFFINRQAILAQQTGLWDFVLYDRSSTSATDYCFRVISNTAGTAVDDYDQYPRVVTATGSLGVQFVNGSGTPITSPNTDTVFSGALSSPSVQDTDATLLNDTDKLLEIHNSSSNSGWGVSLAATGGPTAEWESGLDSYPFNASTSANGQLSVDMNASSRTAHGSDPTGAACSTTGTSLGTGITAFSNVVSAITLLTGSPSTAFNCTWRLRDVALSQSIPANQAGGSYVLDITATMVAN